MNPRIIIEKTQLFLKDTRFRQSTMLLVAMVLGMGINFIASIVTARALGPENFGDVKFIQTIWGLLAVLSTFGYFQSGSRILAVETEPKNIREINGTILFVSFLIGICLSIITAAMAYPIDSFFHTHVSREMLILSPWVFVLSVQAALMLILQGVNRIYLLSVLNAIPVLLYLISIFILSSLKLISTLSVLLATQITFLVVIVVIVFWVRPSFKSMKHWWDVIRKNNKTYGGPVYLGSLATIATSYINRLAISYWVDNTSIGFYSLASNLTEPLKLLPNSVATSSFRSFAQQKKISSKIILATVGFTVVALGAALIFFGQPLSWIYTKNFAPVSAMARALSIAAILVGFGDFFNRFLGAHGKGKELRNAAYLVGAVNVAGFFLLVPRWGVWGLIVTAILAGFIYLIFIYGYYRKHVKTEDAEIKSSLEENKSTDAAGPGLGIINEIPDLLESSGGEK
jgi:O-antigen/teichoic acid export membrane protein